MCYINSTTDMTMSGWCGDRDTGNLVISLFCDADFAGCVKTARSTAGVFLAVVGPHTFLPLAAISKRQSAVSHSAPEAELVAAEHGVRMEGLPALTLWSVLLKRELDLATLDALLLRRAQLWEQRLERAETTLYLCEEAPALCI